MKKTQAVSAGIAFVLAIAFILHAQTTTISIQSLHSASADDLAVMLQAVEETTPVPTESVPQIGNGFYSAQNPNWPPLPGNINNLPAWDLGGGNWLLADLDFDYAALEQQDAATHMMARAMGLEMDSQDVAGNSYTFDTNALWLEITSVSNGLAYLNLHNATDEVYEMWSKTDLLAPSWNIEQEIWPDTNQTVTLFTVPVLDRTNLFIWARDWTGITSNGNQTPEWWFWKYFGTVDLSDTNLDNIGWPLLDDYQNGIDPNIIFFSLQFSNEVHTSIVNGTAAILGGTPFYEAVLVNDTNNADAFWQPYTGSNIVVSLNSGEGVYTVRVGLRGLPENTQQSWRETELTYSAPVALSIIITEPATTTVSTPLIQLQGFVNETLSALTYDVSNAVGVITNQPGYWQASFYDPNILQFTTNSFQCYDVKLTNGLNTVTLHATDLAGNTAMTNFSVTLDYSTDTTPPVLNLIWPQDETAIGGGNFTVQAQVDDATATIMASMNGGTSTFQGVVERSGTVWFNNLPLADGTNTLSITATDAAGNASTTNITLIKAVVSVTIDPLPDNQLNQSFVSVTGTISDPSYDVWVNGVEAYYVDDAGDWEADGVPVSPTGTAVFDVEIYVGDPDWVCSQWFKQIQPAVISLMSYIGHNNWNGISECSRGTFNETINWLCQSGGVDSSSLVGIDGDCVPENNYETNTLNSGYNGYSPIWEIKKYSGSYSYMPFWQYIPNCYKPYWAYIPYWGAESWNGDAYARVMIVPSGQAAIGTTALYLVQAQVTNEDSGLQIPGSQVQFQNQLSGTATVDVTNDDGSVWSQGLVLGPSGATLEATPSAPVQNISFNNWQVTNVQLKIFAITNGMAIDLSTNAPEFCVGQRVTFSGVWNYDPGAVSTNYNWAFSSKFVNHSSQASQSASTNWEIDSSIFTTNEPYAYWVSGGNKNVYLHETLHFSNGQSATFSASGQFTMYRPTGSIVRKYDYGTPTVVWNPMWGLLYVNGTLQVGTGSDTANSMNFYGGIQSKYSGSGKWVQIIDVDMTGTGYFDGWPDINPSHTGVLDNQDPFGPMPTIYANIIPNGDNNTVPLDDAPAAASYGQIDPVIRFNFSATDYLMFKPDGDGIWVPLGKTTSPWSVHCNLEWPTTDLGTNNQVTGPGDLDASTVFPAWTHTLVNP